MEAPEQQLWIEYRQGADAARAGLLTRYLPFAKKIARALYARAPVSGVEFGDYLHLAYAGLLEAMQRYRHESNAQFATFAAYRIRGSVLNGIAKMTELGERLDYRRRVQRERTRSLLGETTATPDSFTGMIDLIVGIALMYQLDELSDDEVPAAPEHDEPYASRAYDDLQRQLREVLLALAERERQIVHYHYFHQMDFADIALALNLSRGRVSQLHKRALEALREALQRGRWSQSC